MSGSLAYGTSALVAGFLTSCGEAAPPRWVDVVSEAEQVRSSIETSEHALADGRAVRLVSRGDGIHLELTLRAGDWVKQVPAKFWLAALELPLPAGDRTNSTAFELTDGTRTFAQVPYRILGAADQERFPLQSFRVRKEGVLIHLAKGEQPPPEMTLATSLSADGSSSGRVRGPHFSGRGFQVWPGQALSMVIDVPPGAVLRFATTLDPPGGKASPNSPPTIFRVLQEEQRVFEYPESEARMAWHTVALPRSGRTELTFSVHGSFANTCFLDPVLGPGEIGTPGRRPWKEQRPGILVFLADTFRADNMSAYGGTHDLTPNLDRFAREGLLFRRAWSVGTYTLPAHVSMFAGVLPMQAGLNAVCNAMPEELDTIAEMLSAAGYRTGAITSAGYVSYRFGLDQGFASFHEDWTSLDSSLAVERARSFLEFDDGRPVFLFLHTYETHKPYLVSDETRARLGERLGIQGVFAEIEGRLKGMTGDGSRLPADPTRAEEASAVVRETLPHYYGAVADLDTAFGRLLAALDERDWLEHGCLVFTSDHGEAFAEHGEITHCGTVFEEKIRIPLLIQGRGITPRVVDHSASLVDLVPTLAQMAGLARRPEWTGESLLALAADRPVFSYELGAHSTVAVIEGSRKVIGFEKARTIDPQRILGAYDLAVDPGERKNVADERESWARELLRRFGPALQQSFEPLVEGRRGRLDEADLQELSELGYVDGVGY